MAAPAPSPPPASWPRYFDDDHAPDDRRAALVDELTSFFATEAGLRLVTGGARRGAGGGVALALDHAAVTAAAGSADLVASLEVQPDEGLACLACAAAEVRTRGKGGKGGGFEAGAGSWRLSPAPPLRLLSRPTRPWRAG